MGEPERIWAKTHGASTDVLTGQRGLVGGWNEYRRDGQCEYLRRDGETLKGIIAIATFALDQWESCIESEYSGTADYRLMLADVQERRAALAKMGE
ncbi:hypothetical protein HOY34_13760 [Xinfangfangia sp. D13-10-4-6]|uniref:hypothetical protein n=1 Tax=Pseudogemmobacter hezensis TaxID=2737662 RepID=UPI001552D4E6|nr:hypothetical protein [Pseudogemmobacter hezensis]NPD16261.1 hypothetical protein [Pseudogemmobacter hezensis]